MEPLTPETFLAAIEMLQQQLRIKRDDHWSPAVCKLKYGSFCSEFPEVNDAQFFWCCEQWIQNFSSRDFAKFPTWGQLMVSLYASENGRANRSWGFKRELPQMVSPSPEQVAMLPGRAKSIAAAADPQNAAAYVPFEATSFPALPQATSCAGDELSTEEWAAYLRELAREVDGKTN